MITQPRTVRIYHYDDKLYRRGKLLGILHLLGGQALNVWDESTHKLCQQLAAASKEKSFDVIITTQPSIKWGDALASIEDGRPEHERLDAARATDEAQPRSHKQGGYEARMISKAVQRTVDDRKVSIDEVVERR